MSRPHGSKNGHIADVKTSMMSVYDAMGGAEGLLKWAKKNETEYYRMLASLLPKEQKIEFTNPLITMNADDIARLIIAIGRNRGFNVPSSVERIAGQEIGDIQAIQ